MPIPWLVAAAAVAVGTAVVGAITSSSSGGGSSSYEDPDSKHRRKINKARDKLHAKLNDFEAAKKGFDQNCRLLAKNSSLYVDKSLQPGGVIANINNSVDSSNKKFEVVLSNQLDRHHEIKEIAASVGDQVDGITNVIVQANKTLEQLATLYKQPGNKHLEGAIRTLMTYNSVLTLLVPLFDPSDSSSNPSFKINPKLNALVEELKSTLKVIDQLQAA